MAELDHLAVAAATLEEGVAAVEAALGVALVPGGQHAAMATHNRLLGLGPREYLEVIATDPGAEPPGRPRWFGLDRFAGPPRLTHWIARVEDLDAALAAAPDGAGRATDLSRAAFRWRFGVPDDGRHPFDDCFPALIEWQGDRHPAAALPESGCRLLRLEIAHPDPTALTAALPVRDPRVVIVAGHPALRVTISTPHGERTLA
ncbi:VOC family protein [Defluviimonas salinarum]|uniref:VOC family protein n=1 Tax=Defluviimonas salinarum TaxID=2992147 RepID=A0ABT3J0V2_9RHOB|nr:VOC family protein [Defluviimonas salinarum]MCW3781316.1 VOC family protein [Defluviimonas salinarum]